MRCSLTAAVVMAVAYLVTGITLAAESNVYWRADLHQGTSIIAYGQGTTGELAMEDCIRLKRITRAMTAAETRKGTVSAISSSAVRWCNNVRRYSTVTPDPVVPPGSATLSWVPPTQNTDGSALSDLAGYRISYGTSSTALTSTIQVAAAGATGYTVTNLAPGTYYFAVRAYNSGGRESANSTVLNKTVQ